jgi:hypothetical protein
MEEKKSNKNLLFHIGYHKTGTSFLQKQVFEMNNSFNRINQYKINRALIYPGPFHFDIELAKSFIDNGIRDNVINVFSNERLSGAPHEGGRDAKGIADRIKLVAPNAKILVVVREQISAISSSYNQYIRAVGSLSLSEYLNSSTKRDLVKFRKEHFEYHHLISHYIGLFGRENVLCIPFEVLVTDPNLFIDVVLDFADVSSLVRKSVIESINYEPVNASLNYKQIILKRYFNPFISHHQVDAGTTYNFGVAKLLYSVINRILQKSVTQQQSKKFKKRQEELILKTLGEGFYSESNKKLQEFTTFDLEGLGWCMK